MIEGIVLVLIRIAVITAAAALFAFVGCKICALCNIDIEKFFD